LNIASISGTRTVGKNGILLRIDIIVYSRIKKWNGNSKISTIARRIALISDSRNIDSDRVFDFDVSSGLGDLYSPTIA